MNLTQMIEYLKETREVVPYLKSEQMDEIINHLENELEIEIAEELPAILKPQQE